MNIFQVWVQDNFLRKSEFSEDIELKVDEDSIPNEVKNFKINSNKITFEIETRDHRKLSVKIEDNSNSSKDEKVNSSSFNNETKDSQKIELMETPVNQRGRCSKTLSIK